MCNDHDTLRILLSWRIAKKYCLLVLCVLTGFLIQAQSITGRVFFDGNNNGIFESADEVGFGGVTVRAFNANNTAVATTTTALTGSLGSYTLSGLTANTTYRVEFTLPSGYNDGAQASGSRSSVQFVTAGSTANFGLYVPGRCDKDKTVRVVAGCANIGGGSTSVASWDYFADRKSSIANSAVNPHDEDMTFSQVGVPIGMGARGRDKLVFMSTTSAPATNVFPPAPGGASAIYVANYSGTGNSYVSNKLLTKLSSLSPAINVTAQFKVGSVDNVGEYGLGGLDLTDDGKFLYVINMGNGKIVKLDISSVNYASIPSGGYTGTSLPVSEITIPTSISTCTGGRFRPSALEIYAGGLYIGGVCDASTSTNASNLRLKILKMDLTTNVWTTLLDYDLSQIQGGTLRKANWANTKWKDSFRGTETTDGEFQPFVNDIGIDDYGSVIIGMSNRKVFSTSTKTDVGYMLRTFRNANGTMSMENNGTSGPLISKAHKVDYWGANTSPGPGLNTASGFNMVPNGPGGDWFLEIARTQTHPYLHTGGVFILPGTKELVSGFVNPLEGYNTAGARYINYETGVTTYGISITSAKAFALTGAQSVCEPASIEIGNFVWKDLNQNGRQDPGEPALAGVKVTLKTSAGVTIATATTDANGNYIFSNAARTNTSSFIYNLTGLSSSTNYILSVDGIKSQAPLVGLAVTKTNITSGTEDQRDNDASLVGANAQISLTTKGAGANNHSYDFGFFSCPVISTPSPSQTVCSNVAGANITIKTDINTANSIRFVKFTSKQMAGATPTAAEAAAIYAGTAIATVTPTGTTNPYTATYTWNSADFPNTTSSPITYYVYAILATDLGATCRPLQEIVITVVPPPSVSVAIPPAIVCNGANVTLRATPIISTGSCTVQWQTSINGTNWTDISGATGTTYNAKLDKTTRYRAQLVSCIGNVCCN